MQVKGASCAGEKRITVFKIGKETSNVRIVFIGALLKGILVFLGGRGKLNGVFLREAGTGSEDEESA
jgi:hypothetical protein